MEVVGGEREKTDGDIAKHSWIVILGDGEDKELEVALTPSYPLRWAVRFSETSPFTKNIIAFFLQQPSCS